MNKYPEESMNSSTVEVEDEVDLGVGRSYECVFCKRGFNTAQALGGHMNIHRKDRAGTSRNHHNNKSTKKETIVYPQIILPQPIPSPDYHYSNYNLQPASRRFESDLCYDAGTAASSFGNPHGRPDGHYYQQGFNLLQVPSAGEWRLGLRNRKDSEEEVGVRQKQEEELDLELRLGYDYS